MADSEAKPLRELLAQGAEARVFAGVFNSRKTVIKERFPKVYRHPDIDIRLRSARMGQEARMLIRARQAGVYAPAVYFADLTACALYLEWIEGPTAKRFIQAHAPTAGESWAAETRALARAIGQAIAKLHNFNITHGDLTTSNMMLREGSTEKLVMIDFGLSQISTMAKDKAIDLYVCEKAFLSTHPSSEELFDAVLQSYRAESKLGKEVINALDKVRARGRKKVCLG
jgi:TP53 regulating kinase-like protein